MKSALIIDDDPIHIEVARTLLEATGATNVSSATDGAVARTLLGENGPFDLLLLDLNMPDYNGLEFLDYLRQIDVRAAIIIVSAAHPSVRSGAARLAEAHGLNIAGVLEKPLTLQKLVPALAHI